MNLTEDHTSIRRFMTAIDGEKPDRIPVMPQALSHAARISGMKICEVTANAEKYAKAQLTALKRYGYDAVWSGVVDYYNLLAEAFGCRLNVPEDDIPSLIENIVREPRDVDKLRVPDPNRNGRLPTAIKNIEILSSRVGETTVVMGALAGPFSVAANLRGTTQFMGDLWANPDLVHKLCEVATEACIQFGKAQIEAGISGLFFVDALAAPDIIGPKRFKEFVLPHHRKLINEFTKKVSIIYHIDVGSLSVIDDVLKLEINALLPEDTEDLAGFRQVVGDHFALVGTMAAGAMRTKSPVEIGSMCKTIIEKGAPKEGGAFLLFTAILSSDTPPENIDAYVKAAKKYGVYGI